MGGKVGKTDSGARPYAENQTESDEDDQDDRYNLNDGEPKPDFAKFPHGTLIWRNQPNGSRDHPDPRRNRGEPQAEINGDGGAFRADGDDLDKCVRCPNGKS